MFSSQHAPCGTGFESVEPILRRTAAEPLISKQRRNQIDGIELIRLKRDERRQTLCFTSRPFVLCGLPVRALPTGQLLYERRNGKFVLQVAGHPNYGVPFG